MAMAPYAAADGLVRVYPASTGDASIGLVWVHGGGFTAGDINMPGADWVSATLATLGITVMSVDYRRCDRNIRFPLPSDDVIRAWQWTTAHAEELGIDRDQLTIGGASAGGNLAAGAIMRMLETRDPSAPDRAVLVYPTLLAIQPAPDAKLRAALHANPTADIFSAQAVKHMYERYLVASIEDAPLAAVPGLAEAADVADFPRTLIIAAEVDELKLSSDVFATTLSKAGRQVTSLIEPGTIHGYLNVPGQPTAVSTVRRIAKWLRN